MTLARVRIGDRVGGRDGHIGTVTGTRQATPAHQEEYVLVRRRRFGVLHQTHFVPTTWVREATTDARRVTLDATSAQVAGCPPLRPDNHVRADVVAALPMATGVFNLPTLQVAVHDGIVHLTGHAQHERDTRQAMAAARAVPGVLGVQDHSIGDAALVMAVAQALMEDPVTRKAGLQVTSELGEIRLRGELPLGAMRTATALALAVPGVTRVRNDANPPRTPPAALSTWNGVPMPNARQAEDRMAA